MSCYFIELFFSLFVGQVQFSKEPGGQGSRVAFIDESNRAVGRRNEPFGKLPNFTRFGTVSAIAVKR